MFIEFHPAPASTSISTSPAARENEKKIKDPHSDTSSSSTVITTSSSSSSSSQSSAPKIRHKRSLLIRYLVQSEQKPPPVIYGTWARLKRNMTLKTYYFELNRGTLYWSENEPTVCNNGMLSTRLGSCFLARYEASLSTSSDTCVVMLTLQSGSSTHSRAPDHDTNRNNLPTIGVGYPSAAVMSTTNPPQICILFANEGLRSHWLKLFDQHKAWAQCHSEIDDIEML